MDTVSIKPIEDPYYITCSSEYPINGSFHIRNNERYEFTNTATAELDTGNALQIKGYGCPKGVGGVAFVSGYLLAAIRVLNTVGDNVSDILLTYGIAVTLVNRME